MEISSNICTFWGQQENLYFCARAREEKPVPSGSVSFAAEEKLMLPATESINSTNAVERATMHGREQQSMSAIVIKERPAAIGREFEKVSASISSLVKVADSPQDPNMELCTLQCPDYNITSSNSTLHKMKHDNCSDIRSSKANKIAMTELSNSDMSKIKENIANVDCLEEVPGVGLKITSSPAGHTEAKPKKLKIDEDIKLKSS